MLRTSLIAAGQLKQHQGYIIFRTMFILRGSGSEAILYY